METQRFGYKVTRWFDGKERGFGQATFATEAEMVATAREQLRSYAPGTVIDFYAVTSIPVVPGRASREVWADAPYKRIGN